MRERDGRCLPAFVGRCAFGRGVGEESEREERTGGFSSCVCGACLPRLASLLVCGVVCVCVFFFDPEPGRGSGWGRCVVCVWSVVMCVAHESVARLDDLARVNEGPCLCVDRTMEQATPAHPPPALRPREREKQATSKPTRGGKQGAKTKTPRARSRSAVGEGAGALLAPLRLLSNMQKSLRADTLANHSLECEAAVCHAVCWSTTSSSRQEIPRCAKRRRETLTMSLYVDFDASEWDVVCL